MNKMTGKYIKGIKQACRRVAMISEFNFWAKVLLSEENKHYHDRAREERKRLGNNISKSYKHNSAKWLKWKE